MGRRIELESLPMIYLHTRKEGILPKHLGVYRVKSGGKSYPARRSRKRGDSGG